MTSQRRTSLVAPPVIISVLARSTEKQVMTWLLRREWSLSYLANPRFKIVKKHLELRSRQNVRVYRGPVLGVLVRGGRHPHCGPHRVDPGQVDVEAEKDVGPGGEETDGPVTEIVKQDLRENHPDNTDSRVGPDSNLLHPHQFAL